MNFSSNEALIETYLSKPFYFYLVEKLKLQDQPELARIQITECLKLLLLLPFSKGTIAASSEIDEVWHWMILETKQYFALCEKLPTREYLHHRSVVFDRIENGTEKSLKKDPASFSQELKEKLSWLISYRSNFGPFTDQTAAYWPLTLEIMKDKKISLSDLNHLLMKSADASFRCTPL